MPEGEVIDFLRTHALLHGVPEQELRIAAENVQTVTFSDGQPILTEGEAAVDCYFVRSGKVQVSTRNLVGQTLLLAELGVGALVGEIGLLRNERRSSRVTAVGDVWALRLDREAFDRLQKLSPLFHESLLLTARIRMIHRMLRKASIWAAIPDAELRGLAEVTTIRHVAKGETVVSEGANLDRFLMISKGRLEVRGQKRRKTTLHEGDFYGETCLLTDTPSEVSLVASEDCELLEMGQGEFLYVLSYYAPIRKQFIEMLRLRAPHLLHRVTLQAEESAVALEASHQPLSFGKKERWVDLLLWMGGSFIALSVLALLLNSNWLNAVVLLVGGFVGPLTFVSYIRGNQVLGYKAARLGVIFLGSAFLSVPISWLLERKWLFNVHAPAFAFAHLGIPLAVAVIEELAKVIVCAALLRTRQMRFLMDAVVFGAAAGMGFAAIESMIYGWSHLNDASSISMLTVLWMRALLSPFGHGTWTAIAAAGLWFAGAKRSSAAADKSWLRFKSWRAIPLPFIVIAMHTLWDYRWENGLVKLGIMVAVGSVGLTLLFHLIRVGRREELEAITTLNPYVQEPLHHAVPTASEHQELRCRVCGTVSPKETRYCPRCGHALSV